MGAARSDLRGADNAWTVGDAATENQSIRPNRGGHPQSELLVVSGSNYTSHINIIRKGISIKDLVSLNELPAILSQGGLGCAGEKVFIRVLGYPEIIVVKVQLQGQEEPSSLSVNSMETPASLTDISESEDIYLITELDGF